MHWFKADDLFINLAHTYEAVCHDDPQNGWTIELYLIGRIEPITLFGPHVVRLQAELNRLIAEQTPDPDDD